MEVESEVWIKGKETKKNANDGSWSVGKVVSKDISANGIVTITVRDESGHDFMFSSSKGGLDLEEIQLKNIDMSENLDNLIELPYLNEPEILRSLSSRYFQRKVYTYTGNILIAINPLQTVIPDESCEGFMRQYSSDVKTAAVGVADRVKSKSNQDVNEIKRHSIIISGESGSGKTECAKLLTMFLIEAGIQSSSDLVGIKSAPGDDSDDDMLDSSSNRARTLSQDSIMNFSPLDDSRGSSAFSPDRQLSHKSSHKSRSLAAQSSKHHGKVGFFSAYQLSTMERIRQITPILEAFGNACIEHTHNSSRLGKYVELAFTKRGELVGGEIRTYLLENVRVIKQQIKERNFHIFYQLVAGASEEERKSFALGNIEDYFYTNQGGKDVLSNPLVNDKQAFIALKEHFSDLGFDSGSVQNILHVVGGVLHLGQIEFTHTTQLEGQVAEVLEKLVSDGKESELAVVARLCSLSVEELERSLTRRSVLLNKETFHKALTPLQAVNARDAIAKAVYKRLFNFLVQEVNAKLQPTQELPAAVAASVGILDIFGFDSFAVNSFEQLCINYANEALQQHFSQNMFKLEIIEYKREGIPFEDIEFPDNQDSLDLITNGVFTILDDQCRIPNATDKRLASQFYKELASNAKFSASLPQVSAGQFCVHHFAGPVVYTTDNFVDKNLDQLPQDAAELLKSSQNPVLQFDVDVQLTGGRSNLQSASNDGNDLPLPPAMAAYVTRPKAPEATNMKGLSSPTGARMPRRGSIGKAVPFSVVAQLRSELSIMMAHINTTTPHYVCCVNPVERSATAHEAAKTTTDKSARFQSHIVAEQLRYGGILSAVKVARSGLPNRFHFLDFYQRYRSVANPLHPDTATLPLFLSEKDGDSVIKAHCEKLVLSLTNQSDAPVVVSVLQARLEEEMQAIFRKRSVRKWMGSIGGVINQGNAAVGVTKVFLGKHAHTVLESCLYHQLALCRTKIADLMLKFAAKKKLVRTLKAVRLLQKVLRGALARARTRVLRKQKAARGSVQVATPVASTSVSTRTTRSFAEQVQLYKQQDLTIQEQIKKLVNSNKVDEDEPEFITMDFPAVKAELLTYAGKFSASSVINVKTSEASDALAEGYTLLRPEKLIPLTAVGKALNFGRNVKAENRTSSVKSANKVITKDHSMFKTMHKLMDRLRELFELAKLEKDVLETRKRNKSRPNSLVSPMRRASITSGDSSSAKNDPEAAEIDMKMVTLDKIAKLSRTLYQFYHQYIMQIVKEFGYESKYKNTFADDNQYLLGFVSLVETQKPLLSFEKPKQTGAQNAPSPETADGNQSVSKAFPLYIPNEDQQGPQHKGYAPLCTYGGVHFKVLPANHAPGVEYSLNCLHRLLDGAQLMYPIKYLKMIGKSGEGKGKETYYQAATEFGSQSLTSVGATGASKIVLDDFSAVFIASVLFGAKSLYPEHLQVHVVEGKVHLKGFNVDDDLLCQLFKYYGGHTHSGAPSPASPASSSIPLVHPSDLNVLYMLPQMDAPISAAVQSLLTAATAAPSITSAWLKDLHMQNRRYAVLKAVGFTPADLTNLTLPIALPTHAAAQIQHMLVKIGKALSQGAASGLPLTHSDLLAALEAGTAEKYAELRIQSSKTSPFELFESHRARQTPAKPSASQGKATLTMAVDTMTAEVLNTLDFSTLDDSTELGAAYAALFDNFSYLPSLHLRNISESQLALLFGKILEVNKKAFARQESFRSSIPASPATPPTPSSKNNPVRPSVRTTVKSVVLCGLTQQAAKALHGTSVVQAIQSELGVKVSFDVALGKK